MVSGRRSPCSSPGWSAHTLSRARLCSGPPRSVITRHSSSPRALPKRNFPPGKFKVPIGGSAKAGEARQTTAEIAAQLLELEGKRRAHRNRAEHGRGQARHHRRCRTRPLLDRRRKEVFEGRRVGWKSGKATRSGVKNSSSTSSRVSTASLWRGAADGGLFEVYEAPTDEGNDALAHMLGEEVAM